MEKVSIIIPFYNCPFIDRAIKSALDQSYPSIEVIVVNDGSFQYVEKIKPFAKDVQYIEKANGGAASALNAGIKHATGDYFTWLSSDDLYHKKKVETQLAFMKENEAKVSYSPYYLINRNDQVTSPPIGEHFPNRHLFLKRMSKGGFINGCTVMLDTGIFSEIGLFDESLLYTHDYDLWARVCIKYPFFYLNNPLVYYRVHDGMGSKRHQRELRQEIRIVRRTFYKIFNDLI